MLNQFNQLTAQMNNLQNQVSTGLSVQAPADNPAAMANTLNYLADECRADAIQQQHFHVAIARHFGGQRATVAPDDFQPRRGNCHVGGQRHQLAGGFEQLRGRGQHADQPSRQRGQHQGSFDRAVFIRRHRFRFRAVHHHDGRQRQRDRRDLQRQQLGEPGGHRRGHDGVGGRSGRQHRRHRRARVDHRQPVGRGFHQPSHHAAEQFDRRKHGGDHRHRQRRICKRTKTTSPIRSPTTA